MGFFDQGQAQPSASAFTAPGMNPQLLAMLAAIQNRAGGQGGGQPGMPQPGMPQPGMSPPGMPPQLGMPAQPGMPGQPPQGAGQPNIMQLLMNMDPAMRQRLLMMMQQQGQQPPGAPMTPPMPMGSAGTPPIGR